MFGDDPDRYATAKGRKAFAGTALVTRSSGLRTVVVARAACNQRLVDACYLWAFAALTASPGARRCYDAHRARGATHHQALRALGNRLVGILHGCLAHRVAYQEQVAWPAAKPQSDRSSGGAGGCNPPAYWPLGSPGGQWRRWGSDAARSSAMGRPGSSAAGSGGRRRRHYPAGEFGRRP